MSTAPKSGSGGSASLASALVALTRLPLAGSETDELLRCMVEICQDAFPRPVTASISMGDPTQPTMLVAGSKLAQSVDGAQTNAGEGPSQAAWSDGSTCQSCELGADVRWPRLRVHLRSSPVRSALSVPIRAADKDVGTLNLYSVDDGLANEGAREAAELLGGAVSAVLHEVNAKSELRTAADQLRTALESRATIDQAKGIVMAIRGCGPDEAFEILAQISSSSNVKLRDLAARMVEKTSQGIESLPEQRRSSRRPGGRGAARPPSS